MGRYIVRRLLQGLVVVFGVTVFVFIVTRVIGDPVKFMLPLSATPEEREARREAMGLNEPLIQQFFTFLGDLLHGDLNGVTTIPVEIAAAVAEACPAYIAAEAVILNYLKAGNVNAKGYAAARRECQERIESLAKKLKG